MAPKSYSKRMSTRIKSFKKRSTARRTSLYSGVAVRGVGVPGEVKCLDTEISSNFTATTGVLNHLNPVAEGSSFFNRIGRKIALKSISINAAVQQIVTTNGLTQEIIRYIIVFDKQANGAAPTYASVFQDVPASGTASNPVTAFVNIANRDRYVIIIDETLVFSYAPQDVATTQGLAATFGGIDGNNNRMTVKHYKPLGNRETQFGLGTTTVPASGAIASLSTGSLYLITIGQAGGQYQLNGTIRVRFTDN